MKKQYYVERKANNVWVVAAEDGSDAQEFNEQGRAIRCCVEMNNAEITRLNARVAELEAENEDSRVFEIDGKQFLTTTQAAKALCCHYSNVYRMAEVGAIPKPINMGIKKKFLWLKSDIDGFIKSRMSEGGAA